MQISLVIVVRYCAVSMRFSVEDYLCLIGKQPSSIGSNLRPPITPHFYGKLLIVLRSLKPT
jgi:hypothetical protein